VAVPSALTLSADHRKHFLSTLVMLITGQSVRAGTTDPSILHLILTMLRKWLLDPNSAHLTAKELLVIIQRIAQVRARQAEHRCAPGCTRAMDQLPFATSVPGPSSQVAVGAAGPNACNSCQLEASMGQGLLVIAV